MNKTIASILIGLVAVLSFAREGSLAQTELEKRVDSLVGPYVTCNDFSGAILIAKGEEVLISKAYGLADREWKIPNTTQTKFHIASITKPITATAVMVLLDRGKWQVTDRVSKFLPDYPRGNEISLHHLLTHSSGIPDYNAFPDYQQFMLTRHPLAETVAWFKNHPLEFQPGARHQYSNCNFVLLAHLIEVVSGMDYAAFLSEAVFKPAGMTATGNYSYEEVVDQRAQGYSPGSSNNLHRAEWYDKSFKIGSGSLYSTVEDLFRLVRALQTGRILKPETRELMWTTHISHYGYGWGVGKANGQVVVSHDGSAPGFHGELGYLPENQVFVVFLANIRTGISRQMGKGLFNAALGQPYEMPDPPVYTAVEAAKLSRYCGEYWFPWEGSGNPFTIYQQGENLYFHWRAVVDGKLHGVLLNPAGPDKFINRGRYDQLTFVIGPDGVAAKVLYKENGKETECPRTGDAKGMPD